MLELLQIIISVVVIYFLFSVVVFCIVEWISGILQLRGRMLREAIMDLFRDRTFGEEIYTHPIVESLRAPKGKLTSYIPASGFAAALIERIGSKVTAVEGKVIGAREAYADFVKGIETLPSGHVKTLLLSLSQQAENNEQLTSAIEKWFNDCMDRVSGWYKRKIKTVTLIIAAIVTIGFNVDTIYILQVAKADPVLRQKMNDLGDRLLADSVLTSQVNTMYLDADYHEEYVNDSSIQASDSTSEETEDAATPPATATRPDRMQQLSHLNELIGDTNLPVGWPVKKNNPWLYIILGWFITTIALSAGAPFWFDMLKKLVNLRSTGPKPIVSEPTLTIKKS